MWRRRMSGLSSCKVLHPDWYQLVETDGVSDDIPGLYEWRIDGVGCYIGQYSNARRPLREYGLNVGRILAERPYRKSNPDGFRLIHRELAAAANRGRFITLTLLENCALKDDRNCRERELIKLRREEAKQGGLPVLNSN